MIREINYNGSIVKCEVKVDILIVVLLCVSLFIVPIWILIAKEYVLAAVIHIIVLLGILISKGEIFKKYIPIEGCKK